MKQILLVFGVLLVLIPACSVAVKKDDPNAMFCGKWETIHGNVIAYTELFPDGTYRVEGFRESAYGRKSAGVVTGTWRVRERSFIWTYDKPNKYFKPGEEEVNLILEASKYKFALQEENGNITYFAKERSYWGVWKQIGDIPDGTGKPVRS